MEAALLPPVMNEPSAPAAPGEITELLAAARGGDRAAGERLYAAVYQQLRAQARRQLGRNPRGGDTLSTTALVHEAYLRLAQPAAMAPQDRGHFFAIAATAMRQIAIDHARRRLARKRGAGVRPFTLDGLEPGRGARSEEILAVDQALQRLEALDPRLGQLVELRFFAGLSMEQAAAALGVTDRTLRRDWRKACAFLGRELGPTVAEAT